MIENEVEFSNTIPTKSSNTSSDDDDDDNNDDDDLKQQQKMEVVVVEEDDNNDYTMRYNDRKPKWWRQLAGRRGSKAQRRAYRNEELEYYKLPSIEYGKQYDLNRIFDTEKNKPIWLEIGCGQGDNVLVNALHSEINIIGADVHKPSIGLILSRIDKATNSSNNNNTTEQYNLYTPEKDPFNDDASTEEDGTTITPTLPPLHDNNNDNNELPLYSNVRIFAGDGIKLLYSIPTSSLSKVIITFPDPWYKDRHKEFRILQGHTLDDIHRVLLKKSSSNDNNNNGGGQLCLATDHPVFQSWVLKLTKEKKFRQLPLSNNHHRTTWLPVISKYEQKGWEEDRPTLLTCWEAI